MLSRVKKILVGLDFTSSDQQVLKYLKTITLIAGYVEKIVFVTVHNEIDIPDQVLQDFPTLKTVIDGRYVKEMIEETHSINFLDIDVDYLSLSGNTLHQLITKSKEEDIDLIMVGRKTNRGQAGIAYRKLIRKSSCDVFIVPDNLEPTFEQLLVASDFSDYSRIAFLQALEFAREVKGKITLQHVYQVPVGYSKTGKSFTEFAAIMRENAEKNYQEFLSEIDLKGVKVTPLFTLSNKDEEAENIAQTAEQMKADVVVVGAKGRTNLAAFLLGSVTEQLLEEMESTPAMVVKKKGDEFDLFDAFRVA